MTCTRRWRIFYTAPLPFTGLFCLPTGSCFLPGSLPTCHHCGQQRHSTRCWLCLRRFYLLDSAGCYLVLVLLPPARLPFSCRFYHYHCLSPLSFPAPAAADTTTRIPCVKHQLYCSFLTTGHRSPDSCHYLRLIFTFLTVPAFRLAADDGWHYIVKRHWSAYAQTSVLPTDHCRHLDYPHLLHRSAATCCLPDFGLLHVPAILTVLPHGACSLDVRQLPDTFNSRILALLSRRYVCWWITRIPHTTAPGL